jgi:glucokinase
VSRASGPLTIGIDIGGSKVAGGVVDPRGQVLAQTRGDTPASDVTRTRGVIVDMVRELAAAHPVTAVGIGAAGWIDATRDIIRFAPHLAWRDEPLREQVAAAVDLPVVVENDANAAAWAEYKFGAARELSQHLSGAGRAAESMVLVAIGTGIGGGIVLGGQLVRGAHGYAGEPGHQVAVPDGLACTCGRRGCLEQYASGTALLRFARTGAVEHPAAAAGLLELAGGLESITGPLVTTAARAGDKVARDAFDQVGKWLGVGLADLVQVLDPRLIVIGGGVAEAGELLLAPTRDAYRHSLGQRGRLPAARLRVARLGNVAGVVGAADLARQ